ncbi:MAG: hypothetical protein HQL93_13010 [Magnetococcales bacterium]|nr:hypothetical protein [Magnetococcales bacterium]
MNNNAVSAKTVQMYKGDVGRFIKWGGSIPAEPKAICAYLADHKKIVKPTTLFRWRSALVNAHGNSNKDNPANHADVKTLIREIKMAGIEKRKVRQLSEADVHRIVSEMGPGPKAVRDKAIFLLAHECGLSREGIVRLNAGSLEEIKPGCFVLNGGTTSLKVRSKGGEFCPVAAVEEWMKVSGKEGPLFVCVNRHGGLGNARLTGHGLSLVVKARVAAIGIDPTHYSGNSIRRNRPDE